MRNSASLIARSATTWMTVKSVVAYLCYASQLTQAEEDEVAAFLQCSTV
jgi:hypothetical protein